jgi:uncharacterized protein (DUF736 family)
MSEYDNTNRGVLFKNDQKGNPKRPQYRGSINVAGADYNISAWIKESRKDGSKFMSLSVEPKKDAKPKVQVPVQDFVDDELPPF